MISLKNQLYRVILALYSTIIFYIAYKYWLEIILLNPESFALNIFLFKITLNTNILAYASIMISIGLIIIGIYKEEVSYIISSSILVFTVVILSLIGIYIEGFYIVNLTKGLTLMSIELILLLISSGLIEYFKPYLKYYKLRGELLDYSLNISILDVLATGAGLILGVIALSIIPYIITENIYISIVGLKERIITMLGSITYLILTYPLTIFFIYIGIFLFILYLFKNVVDPLVIFIGKGRGQALSMVKEDLRNSLSKAISYVRDTDRYMNIGFITIVLSSTVVFLIAISYSPSSTIKYIIASLSDLLTFKHGVAMPSLDNYINKAIDQRAIEEYIDRVLRFLRFILSLLF